MPCVQRLSQHLERGISIWFPGKVFFAIRTDNAKHAILGHEQRLFAADLPFPIRAIE